MAHFHGAIASVHLHGNGESQSGGAPTAPTTVAGTPTGSTTATLTWVDASSDETSFTVQIRTAAGPGSWGDAVGATNPTAAGVQTFSATTLTASTAYDVRVKASNGSGDSAYVQSAASFTTDTAGGGGGGSPVSHTSSGALASDAAAISGNATQAAAGVHSSSGSLSSDEAAISGAATHLVVHTSSGALASDEARIVGAATGPYVQNSGAGKPRKPRKRKVIVSIDGEEFEVSSEAEAVELLESAKAEAEKKAADVTAKAVAASNRPKRKLIADVRKSLATPTIEVSKSIQPAADKVQSDIAHIYADAIRAVEISALMRRQADEQDDEDILLMLL